VATDPRPSPARENALPAGLVAMGRFGPPHGVSGQVLLEPLTDDPEGRLVVGAPLHTFRRGVEGTVVLAGRHWHSGRLVVTVEGVDDRTGAEALRGTMVVRREDEAGDPGEGAYWDHQLVGLRVVTPEGAPVGEVTDVVHTSAQPLLQVALPGGGQGLLPFVAPLVPDVDLAAGTLTAVVPEGLFDL
jgi:16S rRNA processing protein RimM